MLGTLAMSVVGAVLCFVPGLDAPNYHAAFVTALVGSLIAGPLGVAVAHRVLAARQGQNPFVVAGKRALVAACAPIALLLLNGLRVRQCDVFSGVTFMLIGPVFSIVWAALLGAALGVWWPKKRHAVPLFYLLFVVWALLDVLHIYRHPAIFAYNPFAGFFSGAIYDAVIVIDARLLLYRLNNVVQIGVVLAATWAAYDVRARRASLAALGRVGLTRFAPLVALAVAAFAFWVARGDIGYQVTRSDVQAQLGRSVADDRIVLWYDRSIPEAEAKLLLEGHRFRLEQIEAELGHRFPRRITSYVYASQDQKRRLMGAGQVYIAKPWLDEIHLNRVPFDQPVIRHELAHVVLGIFAPAPFHIPTNLCVIPQMALVEGAAEAFEWDTGQLSPHEWSAAMRAAKRAPDLRGLLAPSGFYDQGSETAYTLSGSFVRWVIDHFGIDKLEAIYADGDFARVLGVPLDELVARWEGFLDALAVPADAAGLATGRFNTPAIHKRPCGLDVARLESEAAKALQAGDRVAAREAYEQVVAWIPEDAMKRKPLVELAAGSGDLAATRVAYWTYLAVPGNRNPVDDAQVREQFADAIARRAIADRKAGATSDASIAEAHRLYASLAAVPQPEDRWRNVLVKAYFASEPQLAEIALPYFFDGRREVLDAAAAALPEHPLIRYLVARRLFNDKRHAEAVPALRAVIAALATPDPAWAWAPWVRREAARLVAQGLWALADYAAAGEAYRFVAGLTPYGGDRERYLDWAERCAWKVARTPPSGAREF